MSSFSLCLLRTSGRTVMPKNVRAGILCSLLSTTAEIERKFHCNSIILQYCRQHALSSRDIRMSDVYFDNSELALTTRDMWLRQRNDTLELKWPQQHQQSNQQSTIMVGLDFYQESVDLSKISEVLHKVLDKNVSFENKNSNKVDDEQTKSLGMIGLRPFGTILTNRTRYNLCIALPPDLKSKVRRSAQHVYVDIDSVRYIPEHPHLLDDERATKLSLVNSVAANESLTTYQIGEIEFNNDSGSNGNDKKDEQEQSRHDDKALNEDIMHYVFQTMGINAAPVRGKMLEYLIRFRPEHYEALRKSGLLASKGL